MLESSSHRQINNQRCLNVDRPNSVPGGNGELLVVLREHDDWLLQEKTNMIQMCRLVKQQKVDAKQPPSVMLLLGKLEEKQEPFPDF
jgi:hypothetical protein